MNEIRMREIALAWIMAWNSHDLDRIMAHYAEEIEFTSPFAVELLGAADGTVRGTPALRAYFARALEAYPDLHFEFHATLVGLNSMVVYYRSVRNLQAAEMMMFDANEQVVRIYAHYDEPRQ